ncbi:hypothetical protein MASR1M50_17140 [Burkholderiales bacterium]
MPMSRTTHLPLVLTLAGLLAACAATDNAPPASASALPSAPAPAGVPAAPVSAPTAEAPADTGPAKTEPLLIRGNDRVVAPPPIAANAPARGASTSLKFESAPVAEVVRVMLGDLLKVDYVVHPPLNGTITLTTRQTVSPDRALLLLEAALQANGTVMARDSRGVYHVGTPESLKGIVSAPVLAEPGKPLPPGYGSVIIPLEYLGAGEMANILRPLVSSDAIVRVDSLRNLLVMRGTRAEAEGWLDLVRTFDVNLLRGMSVGVFPLKHTSAAEVDAALRLLSGGTASGAAGAAAVAGAAARAPAAPARSGAATAQAAQPAGQAAPAGLGEASPLFGALRVIPIERINAVLVVTPRAAYLEEARYWIEQFDRPNLNSAEPQLFVYKVQNGSADHLAELLNGIYGGTAQQPGFSGATGIAPGLTGVAGATPNVNSSFASRFGANRNTSLGSTGGLGASSSSRAAWGAGRHRWCRWHRRCGRPPGAAAGAGRGHHHPGRQRARHGRPHQQHPADPRRSGRVRTHRRHPQAPGRAARPDPHRSLHRRSHPGRRPRIRPAMDLQRRRRRRPQRPRRHRRGGVPAARWGPTAAPRPASATPSPTPCATPPATSRPCSARWPTSRWSRSCPAPR